MFVQFLREGGNGDVIEWIMRDAVESRNKYIDADVVHYIEVEWKEWIGNGSVSVIVCDDFTSEQGLKRALEAVLFCKKDGRVAFASEGVVPFGESLEAVEKMIRESLLDKKLNVHGKRNKKFCDFCVIIDGRVCLF